MDRGGRVAGMLVFILGIVILLVVFGIAYRMFFASPQSEFLPGSGTNAAGLGTAVIWIFVRIALLFVMTLTGSFVAARGIQLYLGSAEHPKA